MRDPSGCCVRQAEALFSRMRPCPGNSGMDKRRALDDEMHARVALATYEEHLLSLHLGHHSLSLDDAGVTLLNRPCPSMEKTSGRATADLCSVSDNEYIFLVNHQRVWNHLFLHLTKPILTDIVYVFVLCHELAFSCWLIPNSKRFVYKRLDLKEESV